MAPRRSARLENRTRLVTETVTATATTKAPTTTKKAAPRKRKSAPKRKTATSHVGVKKKRTGMKSAPNTSSVLGVVDPESNINGTIEILDDEPCDCMLVLRDPAKHMDKFYVIQLIQRIDGFYFVYTRWGRTGTSGSGLISEFGHYGDAVKAFEEKFEEKTGLTWKNRDNPTVAKSYQVVQQNFFEKQGGYNSAKWQYWVDDGIDGKTTGWYDYDQTGSRNVEQLFQESLTNNLLTNRFVESGAWTYKVDLVKMTQTNVKHPNKTNRHIRRHTGEEMDDNVPPTTAIVSPSKISSPVSKSQPVVVTPTNSPSGSIQKSSSSSTSRPPVDSDISPSISSNYSVVKNGNGQWYDVVLNQCNITGSSNNNKYYRMQLLTTNNNPLYYVWFKWGRVGEPQKASATQMIGPHFTEGEAMKKFAKKYKDKTKNTWGDDNFVPVKGKYTRIEIDYEVEAKPDVNVAGTSDEIEYLESTLDPKTKELMEELFSKEIRDNALTSFNLDLKKLPLGVPSQQQIQNGVSLLNKIEDKFNNGDVSESYAELSSQFYTAIPHSFGRRRPPAITTRESIQERYDMCNILLDMYATNEVVRQVKAAKKTKQVPCPTDSHYETLKADLSLVDKKTQEFKTINKYFEETKNSYASSKILDVWAVDRQGEDQRHKKFENLEKRCLLWHGTNVAVVAPIITSGLRIMPHSGGRVGAGIYLASMQQKSAQYTSSGRKFACMFLCEGALGKSHEVTSDGPHAYNLKKAPAGFDSVHAVGSVTPQAWTTTNIDGKSIEVPEAKAHDSGVQSSFQHDEFLLYDEAQVRLRYVLTVKL